MHVDLKSSVVRHRVDMRIVTIVSGGRGGGGGGIPLFIFVVSICVKLKMDVASLSETTGLFTNLKCVM